MTKSKKILANTFIVMMLMLMIRPHLPKSKFLFQLYRPLIKIESSLGINQSWVMFSPNPSKVDAFVIGVVEYQDGTRDSYDFNKTIGMNILGQYLHGGKYRKYTSEHLRIDKKSFLWSDGADFAVKKLAAKNIGKVATQVTLIRFWSETPDWNKQFIKHGTAKAKYNSYVFYKKGL